MNPIAAHLAAGHVDHITRAGRLHVALAPIGQTTGHDADGAAVYQWLAEITLVEHHRSVDRRYARFVAARAHSRVHPAHHSGWVEQSLGDVAAPVRWTEAEDIGVGNRASTQTCAEDVTVDADDAGHGAAVGVESARRVVRLHLHAQAPVVIPGDDSGIVVEHAQQPVDLLGDIEGGLHDVRLEQRINRRILAGLRILVVDQCCERLVLAVLRPGLRQTLQFHIRGGLGRQALFLSQGSHPKVAILRLDGLHLSEVECQQARFADVFQLGVGYLEVDDRRFLELDRGAVRKR